MCRSIREMIDKGDLEQHLKDWDADIKQFKSFWELLIEHKLFMFILKQVRNKI